MSVAISVEIPDQLFATAQQQAMSSGTSVDQWLQAEVERNLQLQQKTDELFASKRAGASEDEFYALLRAIPHAPPMLGDELP